MIPQVPNYWSIHILQIEYAVGYLQQGVLAVLKVSFLG